MIPMPVALPIAVAKASPRVTTVQVHGLIMQIGMGLNNALNSAVARGNGRQVFTFALKKRPRQSRKSPEERT
jgi:hypothetical protein